MSDTDSFIDEVTEEVRRDRLYGYFKKYGWIGAVIVLLIVGGTAWREWDQSKENASAQALGDAILRASEISDAKESAERLATIPTDTANQAAVLAFERATELANAGDQKAAAELLNTIAVDPELAPIYRQIAGFRALVVDVDQPDDVRRAGFEGLIQNGGVLRVLSEEQLALMDLEAGNTDEALTRLTAIAQDAEATEGLRRRASQLIVALGGELPETVGGTTE